MRNIFDLYNRSFCVVGKLIYLILLLIFFSCFFTNEAIATTKTYTITDLGVLSGDSESSGNQLNNLGHVIGLSANQAVEGCNYFTSTCGYHGFIYNGSNENPIGYIPGGSSSYGLAINDFDQAVGFGSTGNSLVHGFLYSNGNITDLGTLGGTSTIPYDINNLGQIVGWSKNSNSLRRAFLYQNSAVFDIGTLPGDDEAEAYSINEHGVIVGWSYSSTTGAGNCQIYAANCAYHAYSYNSGVFTNLGMLPGGTQSEAIRVNGNGQIVGFSNSANSNIHAFLYSNGTMSDLGILSGGTVSVATDINSSGEVVGFGNIATGSTHGFIYKNGTMVNLDDLLPANSGWTTLYAYGINDSGQVSGEGIHNGIRHAFLMTPQIIDLNLNVPILKQTSQPWGNQVYDSANVWSYKSPTIASWGCALTSAAMVFQYHGIKKLPDGTTLDPGTLNSWLKSQKDGYIRNGLVNWLSLTRLSKLAKNINNLTYHALEYVRKNTNDKTVLTADINAGLPDILQEPGHFIVAKGINGSSYDINDPFYDRTLLTEHYNNNFQSLGTYKPSNTDLSYILLVLDKDIEISLSGGNSQDGQIALQEYISDAQTNSNDTNQVNIYYLPKPETGEYTINLTATSLRKYNLDIYLYDQDGNAFQSKKRGSLNQDGTISIPLIYESSLYPKEITYASTILDLATRNEIKDEKLKLNLIQLLIKAKVQNVMGNKESEIYYLKDLLDLISLNEASIPSSVYSDLVYDINYLSSDH